MQKETTMNPSGIFETICATDGCNVCCTGRIVKGGVAFGGSGVILNAQSVLLNGTLFQ